MIADNKNIVVTDPLSSIKLYDYQLTDIYTIASSPLFTSVGSAPGISDDGKIVTFYGNLSQTGATTLNLTSGPGIFASIPFGSGTRKIERIAGVAGDGSLDPGETHEDTNNNGIVDPGEDKGIIASFVTDQRVGVAYDNNIKRGTVAYLALDKNNKKILVSSNFAVSSFNSGIDYVRPSIVAQEGSDAKNVSDNLTGTIQDLKINDPVNNKGQLAFWVKTSTSQEAIVRAKPVLKPILIVPGIGGSFPIFGKFGDWLLNRGGDPTLLEIEPILHSYDDLIKTLENAGYVKGVNLFAAPYDWRLNRAPIDNLIDGKINRNAEQLTNNTYEFAVDHLAFWLKEAMKGWRSQFTGVPENEIPPLDSVDVIAHSTGGLVTRSYIQSNGYGGTFKFNDNGKVIDLNLPKINNFFMIGVPNRGVSKAWNPLNNNFIGGPGAELLKLVCELALTKVNVNNATVRLSGDPNVPGAIRALPGQPLDAITFINQYVPTVRSLLATYPFVAESNSTNTLKTIESIDPSERNRLLLDLNNGFDSAANVDPNGFADLVNRVQVIYGTNKDTQGVVIKKKGPDLEPKKVLWFNLTVPKATLFKLYDVDKTAPSPDEEWYKDIVNNVQNQDDLNDPNPNFSGGPNNNGDGTVPLISAEGTFIGQYQKPNIDLTPKLLTTWVRQASIRQFSRLGAI